MSYLAHHDLIGRALNPVLDEFGELSRGLVSREPVKHVSYTFSSLLILSYQHHNVIFYLVLWDLAFERLLGSAKSGPNGTF
jgi:hypothetical protein